MRVQSKAKGLGIVVVILLSLALATAACSPGNAQSAADSKAKNDSMENTVIYDEATVVWKAYSDIDEPQRFETSDPMFVKDIARITENIEEYHGDPPDLSGPIYEFAISLCKGDEQANCKLLYDDLYEKAYIETDGRLFAAKEDDARYIRSLFEVPGISKTDMDATAVDLFAKHGWTLDYLIGQKAITMKDISEITGFESNAYYFAYNNELSKDIGLDMTGYMNREVAVEIYRVRESLPQKFYPAKGARGIVVKSDGEIVGAYLSAGRHSAYDACSLNGKAFDEVTAGSVREWIRANARPNDIEKELCKKTPEEIIKGYFAALGGKDKETAAACLSKERSLGALTANMGDDELFDDDESLPLTDGGIDNIKSAKCLKVTQREEDTGRDYATFVVEVDMQ
jgi:hypothetical protein